MVEETRRKDHDLLGLKPRTVIMLMIRTMIRPRLGIVDHGRGPWFLRPRMVEETLLPCQPRPAGAGACWLNSIPGLGRGPTPVLAVAAVTLLHRQLFRGTLQRRLYPSARPSPVF